MNFGLAVRGWRDLLLPGAFQIVLKGIGFAILALLVLAFALAWVTGLIVPDDIALPWVGQSSWLPALAGIAALATLLFASIFLMVPVASMFTGFFLEDVAELVEDAHYPNLPRVAPQPFLDGLLQSLRFFGVILAANLVALMIYPFILPLAPILFLCMNGYLLGREYFQMAAQRRMSADAARLLYLRNRHAIWFMGGLMALPLAIPVLNLVVPVVGAAAFTHLFHRLARS